MKKLNFNSFPIIKTERLLLRKLESSDDLLIYNYQSNKENFLFVDMPVYTALQEAQNYIVKMNNGIGNNKWIIWAIADANTDEILGTISIWNISKDQSKAEIGYGLFPGNLGKGIMSEALKEVVKFGFDNLGLKAIKAYTNAINVKSIALLDRNGFTKISSFLETETSNGEPIEMVIYAVSNYY